MVPSGKYQDHLGTVSKCRLLGPTPDLLCQKLWRESPVICILNRPPSDSDERPSVRATTVENTVVFVTVAAAVVVVGL